MKNGNILPLKIMMGPDLKQCIVTFEDAVEYKKREKSVLKILDKYPLARRIFEHSLTCPSFGIMYEGSNELTAVDNLWNRHDIFHALTSLKYGLEITDVLDESDYYMYIDENLIPAITMALLWHDTTRSVIEGTEHGSNISLPQKHLRDILTKCHSEGFVTLNDIERLIVRALRCMVQHNRYDKCHLDAAIVRIAESIDVDVHRSYVSRLRSWKQLLDNNQLTHVLGSAAIRRVLVSKNSNCKRPILITAMVDGKIEHWRKYNWFQIQERVKKKIESTGYGNLLRLKVDFHNGSKFYDFA